MSSSLVFAAAGLDPLAFSSERVASRREPSRSLPDLTGSWGSVRSTNRESRDGEIVKELLKIEVNSLQDVARDREAVVDSFERGGHGRDAFGVFRGSGAGISSGVLVETGLVSFASSSKPIASGWETSLLISDLTGSCWSARSSNRGLRGEVSLQESFGIRGNTSGGVARMREGIIGSSERVGLVSDRSGVSGGSGTKISSGSVNAVTREVKLVLPATSVTISGTWEESKGPDLEDFEDFEDSRSRMSETLKSETSSGNRKEEKVGS